MCDILDRFEIKYLINNNKYHLLTNELKKLFKLDNHGIYYNQSIYFDTFDNEFYNDKIEGYKKRIKPRIRAYRSNIYAEPTNICLEFKIRYSQCIKKERIFIDHDLANKLVKGHTLNKHILDNNYILQKFNKLKINKNIHPVINISYKREAYFSDIFRNLRITFDSQFMSSFLISGLKLPYGSIIYPISPKNSIMELKYNKYLPTYFIQLIQKYELQQQTISKFGLSVDCSKTHIDNLRLRSGLA